MKANPQQIELVEEIKRQIDTIVTTDDMTDPIVMDDIEAALLWNEGLSTFQKSTIVLAIRMIRNSVVADKLPLV